MKTSKNWLVLTIFFAVLTGALIVNIIKSHEIAEPQKGNHLSVNLKDYPVYIKKGYTSAVVRTQKELNAGGWLLIPPRQKETPIRIKNMGFRSERRFLSPFAAPDEEYTFIISLQLDTQTMMMINSNKREIAGIFLARISDNWEISLNGTLLKSEMHTGKNGKITSHRDYRRVHFPVENSLFRAGENQLTFRIIGSPDDSSTGFTYAGPYLIMDYNDIPKSNDGFIVALCAVYIFMGAYHLVLFIIHSKDTYVFYYSLFSTALGVYFITKTAAIYALIPNTDIILRLESGTLYLLVPAFTAFFEMFAKNSDRLSLPVKIYGIFCMVLTVTQAYFSISFRNDTILVWEISGLFALVYLLVYIIHFFMGEIKKQQKASSEKLRFGMYVKIVVITDTGNLFAGTCILILTWFVDILNDMVFHVDSIISTYSFFLFTVGISFILARKFKHLYDRVTELQNAIIKTMAELVEYRDAVTGGHIERTQRGVSILCIALKENKENSPYRNEASDWNIDLLSQSSQLHDVGKIAISDNILKKPGQLTGEEFEEMKKHTDFGMRVIEKIEAATQKSDFLKYAKIFAETHHEKWDGTGYPHGLRGDEIPLPGRIMAIADVYDALTSERSYKKAFTHEEAVRIILGGKGTHFDPVLVGVFFETQNQFRR